jgi:hypothetical protein
MKYAMKYPMKYRVDRRRFNLGALDVKKYWDLSLVAEAAKRGG